MRFPNLIILALAAILAPIAMAANLGRGLAKRSDGTVIAVYVVDTQRLIRLHGYPHCMA